MRADMPDRLNQSVDDASLQSEFLQKVAGARMLAAMATAQKDAAATAEAYQKILADLPWAQPGALVEAWQAYIRDAAERMVLASDTLRQWSDMHLDHAEAGAPPVLIYDYEVVVDGRDLPRPCNYMLLRILPDAGQEIKPWKRPYIIIDPRAGHGPGIGGFKHDSQVGVALKDGHPVYFVSFRQMPEPEQTLADVTYAEAAFVNEVQRLHPDSPKPIIVGNCQGGWATAILAATHPELTGPIVLNGAPMSYWGGRLGQDLMRYSGGLVGGVTPALMASDLGGGIFDGANLVYNFEQLNPGRNWFRKYYDIIENADGGTERFLEFERWWGAFYMMTKAEIRWIVENLFIGNKLAKNEAFLEPGRPVDLRKIRAPIIVFASHGDNITPVAQALNWIVDTYTDHREIEIRGQRIIYMVHDQVGHLGIFVSSKVAKKEHAEMASTLKTIEALAPGLYEMRIEDVAGQGQEKTFEVSFAHRTFDDVLKVSGGRRDEAAFAGVARSSEALAEVYDTTLGPVLETAIRPEAGAAARDGSPMRLARHAFASGGPGMWAVERAADAVRADRNTAAPDNPFLEAEKLWASMIEQAWNWNRDLREVMTEMTFFAIWASPMALWYGTPQAHTRARKRPTELTELPEVKQAIADVAVGGYGDGLLRILCLLAGTRKEVRRDRLERSSLVLRDEEPFNAMPSETRVAMIHRQNLIAEFAPEDGIATLPHLLRTPETRAKALDVTRFVLGDPKEMEKETKALLTRIEEVLNVAQKDAAE